MINKKKKKKKLEEKMSFLSKNSMECAKSELDLFAVPPTQTSIESARIVEYNSVTQANDGPLHFVVVGVEGEYVDLSQTYIYVKAKITTAKGDDITQENIVGPSNLLLHTMFSQVDVSVRNQKITNSVNTYPYRCMFETLLNYGSDAKESHLTSALFYKDTAGQMNSIALKDANINKGFIKRREKTVKGEFELYGRLHVDLFFQDRYLIDQVDLDLKLHKSRDSFVLMSDGKIEYKIQFTKTILYVRQVKISNDVLLAHAKVLEGATIKYPMKRVETKAIVLSSGIHSKTLESVSTGRLPNRLVFGFVDCDSYNGNYKKNCFNFDHYNLNEVRVTVNGQDAPYSPLSLDFKTNLYTRGYYSLFTGIDRAPLDVGNSISMDEYANGYTLFAFDLTPDMCNSDHLNLIRSGNVRIELKFGEALAAAICCIVYMEYESIMEINKARNVMLDFII